MPGVGPTPARPAAQSPIPNPQSQILPPRRPSIAVWHVVVAGFLQDRGQPNGMVRLWHDLHTAHAAPDTAVVFAAWDADAHALAEQIWRLQNARPPTVCLYGYSWGGQTAVNLARALGDRDLRVRHLVLTDPVCRHRWPVGWWRAFYPAFAVSRIAVPPNVDAVHWWRQRNSWPRAGDLTAEDPDQTLVHKARWAATATHKYMDDLREFHATSLRLASQLD